MRIVLDECLPRRLAQSLPGHDVRTVPQMGLAGVKNGELLRRLAGVCEVFVTVDRNLPNQQNLTNLSFAIVVIRAASNRIFDLAPFGPEILNSLSNLQPGDVSFIGPSP